MARLYLFAEGQTEQTFADTILKPHLAGFNVFLQAILIAHARRKGRIHRGGGGKYQPMRDDICRFLAQEQGNDVFFTTMIDLYALAPQFPGLAEAEKLRQQPRQRVAFLEKEFAADIGDNRFIPYIQLHEFEAYLFADPTWFRFFYDRHESAITTLKTIADRCEPELIDDGPQSAPSKRIIAQLADYEAAKTIQGPQVAELIGLSVIRDKCPHFAAWLARLEQLTPPAKTG